MESFRANAPFVKNNLHTYTFIVTTTSILEYGRGAMNAAPRRI